MREAASAATDRDCDQPDKWRTNDAEVMGELWGLALF